MAYRGMMNRPVKYLCFLWWLTTVAYALHPQSAWALFSSLQFGEKWPTVLIAFGSSLPAFLIPTSFLALFLAGFGSGFCVLAWHSWLGAFQPLIPVGFLFSAIAIGQENEEQKLLWRSSFLLYLAMGLLHCVNAEFLAGFEFSERGSLAKDFPAFFRPTSWSDSGPMISAASWISLWVLPLFGIARYRRFGWILFGFAGITAIIIYKVYLYSVFLLAISGMIFDRNFLRTWRCRVPVFFPAPLFFYLSGQALFFFWYLFQRSNQNLFNLVAVLLLAPLLGAEFHQEDFPRRFLPLTGNGKLWLFFWFLYLALPFAVRIPPPFGATHFSAREARVLPSRSIENPMGMRNCEELRERLALRWGYRTISRSDACELYVY